jgi:ABC-type branched-subunit amino acid transport system substrate-binding protein
MTRLAATRVTLSLLLLLGVAAHPGVSEARLTDLESQGKHVYTVTTSPSGGEITAFMGISSVQAPGEAMPCVNCHGADGLGRPESDVIPSNVTWSELTKPYKVRRPGGRERPPYTDETIAAAITKGVDAGGNKLAPAMPLYTLSETDLTALIAYLKRLGGESEAGVTETSIRLATVLPSRGRFAETGKAMESMLRAYLAEVNGRGGIYNRTVELEVVDCGESGRSALAAVNRLIERADTFALVAPYIVGADREIAEAANAAGIPVVGPYTLFPLDTFHLNRTVFYIFSGLREEALAFLDHVAGESGDKGRPTAVISPGEGVPVDVLNAVVEHARKRGLHPMPTVFYPPGRLEAGQRARELQSAGVNLVLFYGSREELAALVDAAAAAQWRPRIFLSGSQVNVELFSLASRLENRLFLAYPVLPSDQTTAGSREISHLMDAHGLPKGPFRAQVSAFCAFKVLLEGLKTVGKQLTREALITALERLYDFDTGLTPKLSYGPNRRIGALGAHILRVDAEKKDLVPVSGWIVPSVP